MWGGAWARRGALASRGSSFGLRCPFPPPALLFSKPPRSVCLGRVKPLFPPDEGESGSEVAKAVEGSLEGRKGRRRKG